MVLRFAEADRSGFSLGVEREGDLGAGDAIELLEQDPAGLTVAEIYRLKIDGGPSARLQRAAEHAALSPGWRDSFRRRLSGDISE